MLQEVKQVIEISAAEYLGTAAPITPATKGQVRKHLEQLKAELLYDPAIPLLGISPKTESRDSSRYTSTHVHSSIIHNTPTVEANRGSTDGQMDKHDVMHIYSILLFSHKKKEILTNAITWADLEDILPGEISPSTETPVPHDST